VRISQLAGALLLALLCPAGAAWADAPNPAAAWQHVSPARAGLSAARLDQIAAQAKAGHSDCLVVVRDGKLAGEWYFDHTGPDTPHEVWSVTKSFASTLVGIAQDEGRLRIGERASRWIPQWRRTRAQAVTVRDLLSMDSGRQWSVVSDYLQLELATDRTAYAVGLAQSAAPGTVWAYNNAAVQTLQRVLARATGERVERFAEQSLFAPLGMEHTTMTTDRAGNAQLFEGIHSTCRDLARFGVLMLDHGRWNGRQVVSPAWVSAATGHASSALNTGYGYLWWLNRPGLLSSPLIATSIAAAQSPATRRGRLVPGAPPGMYWALGLGNQLIQVDPGTRTVVVRLGSSSLVPRPPTFGPAQASRVVTRAVVAAGR
jgi:CubicO group peptidase (beta-lactamase class C family)